MGAARQAHVSNDSPRRLSKYSKYENLVLHKFLRSYHKAMQRRCVKRNKNCSLTIEDLYCMFYKQNGKCSISNQSMTYVRNGGLNKFNLSCDRIDNSKGYELGNVQLVCQHVNVMKAEISVSELVELCQMIVSARSLNV